MSSRASKTGAIRSIRLIELMGREGDLSGVEQACRVLEREMAAVRQALAVLVV